MTTMEITRAGIATLEPWMLEVAHVLEAEKHRLLADTAFMAFAAAQPAPWTLDDCLAKGDSPAFGCLKPSPTL